MIEKLRLINAPHPRVLTLLTSRPVGYAKAEEMLLLVLEREAWHVFHVCLGILWRAF